MTNSRSKLPLKHADKRNLFHTNQYCTRLFKTKCLQMDGDELEQHVPLVPGLSPHIIPRNSHQSLLFHIKSASPTLERGNCSQCVVVAACEDLIKKCDGRINGQLVTVTFGVLPVPFFIWLLWTATSDKFVNQIVKISDNNKCCCGVAEGTMSERRKQWRRMQGNSEWGF